MLTVAEFNAAYGRYARRAQRLFLVVYCAGIPVLFWASGSFLKRGGAFDTYLASAVPHPLAEITRTFALLVFLILLYALLTGILVWFLRRSARREPDLVCPHCSRVLALSFQRVVATRECPRCARELLADPWPIENPPLSREEAQARAARWRRGWAWVSIELVTVAVLLIITDDLVKYLNEQRVLSDRFAEITHWVLLPGLVAWLVWVMIQGYRLRRTQITCPRCPNPQEPGHVAKFGRCAACSQPLVADPPTPAAS